MDKKTKRTLFIAGIVEAAIILFCLIVSILVIVTYNKPESGPNWQQMNLDKNGPLIGWFQNNPTPFFLIIVLPLLVILVLDIIYLIIYASKRESKLSDDEINEIQAQARAEAREEPRNGRRPHPKRKTNDSRGRWPLFFLPSLYFRIVQEKIEFSLLETSP